MMNISKISYKALQENIDEIRKCIPDGVSIAAVVKGNAYGHGLTGISRYLDNNSGISMLVVATISEAKQLILENIKKEILILNRCFASDIESFFEAYDYEKRKILSSQIFFSAYSMSDIEDLRCLGEKLSVRLRCHIRLDYSSGIRGMNKKNFDDFKEYLFDMVPDVICGFYAHIYSAYTGDESAAIEEIKMYDEDMHSIPADKRQLVTVHMLSSVSAFCFPEFSHDMVRIGVSLYGLPVRGTSPSVKPILSITSWVVDCFDVDGGARIDYFGELPSHIKRLALISIGSWDIPGFFVNSWDFDNYEEDKDKHGRCVRIRNHLCAIVGVPCMDTCCVDISGFDDIRRGDEVLVLGNETGVTLQDWISHSTFGMEDCQMLCAGMGRMDRQFS